MDLRAVRRGALHRELRRRPRRTTSPQRRKQSPQRRSSRENAEMEDSCARQNHPFVESKQISPDDIPKPREPLSSKEDALSTDALKSIEDHKSFIAELRPNRRKIKWGSALADWERNNSSQTRISDLSLDDLQIHGKVPIAPETGLSEQAEPEIPQKLGDQIDILEKNIRRCFKTINRVKKEANKQKERANELQEENKALRKAIIALPFPQSQSMRQSWKQMVATVEAMRLTVTQMDEQITMINSRKLALQKEAEQLRDDIPGQENLAQDHKQEDSVEKQGYADECSVASATDYGYNEYPEEGKSSYFQLSFAGVPTVALINNGNSATMTRRMSATPRAA